MAGYGGQLVALDAEAPNVGGELDAGQAYQRSALENQRLAYQNKNDLPIATAQQQTILETQRSTLAQQQIKQAAEDKAWRNQQIYEAANSIDPEAPDAVQEFGKKMQGLADKGVTEAQQWADRPSQLAMKNVMRAYGPQASASGGGAASPLESRQGGGFSGAAGADEDLAQQFQGMDPKAIGPALDKLGKLRQAVEQVGYAKDPASEWDVVAQQLDKQGIMPGASQQVGKYNPLVLNKLHNDVMRTQAFLEQRQAAAGVGLPSQVVPQQVMPGADGALYAVTQTPAGAQAKQIVSPLSKYAPLPGAVDSTGLYNVYTGQGPVQSGGLADYAAKIQGIENAGGAPDAKNPRSSATGDGQFVNPTWLRLMRSTRPDIAQGRTDQELLAMRSDPQLSTEMTERYGQENATKFAQSGQPVTTASLALAHRLGYEGAERVMGAAPETPMSKIVSADVLHANPDMKGQSAGQYVFGIAQRVGNGPVSIPGITEEYSGATGNDFLKSLAPSDALMVKKIANGDLQIPGGFATSKPYWQKLIKEAAQYDPEFNQGTYATRLATRKDFVAGKSAANVTSLNTAIGHMGTLDSMVDGLQNTSLPAFNSVKNWIENATGDPRVKSFDTTKTAVADEMTRVFRGSGGALSDVQGWQKQLDAAGSPEQLHNVVKRGAQLLQSRLEALGSQYTQGMGREEEPYQLLNPHAADTLRRLSGAGVAPASGPPAPAQRVVGQVYQSPKGPVKWTGQGWVMANATK